MEDPSSDTSVGLPPSAASEEADSGLWAMNRNAREGKAANHGKRPCSNVRRKRKARARAGDHWYLPTKIPKGVDK